MLYRSETLPAALICLMLSVGIMLASPAARSETELLVNRSIGSFSTTEEGQIHAQRFTTGSADKLVKVLDVFMPTITSNKTGVITLNADNSGVPGSVIATLTGLEKDGQLVSCRATGRYDWVFPLGTRLTADTSYFLIFNASDNGFSFGERVGSFQFYPRTDLERQDFGWSVDTEALVKESRGDSWSATHTAPYNIGAFRIMGFGPNEDPNNPGSLLTSLCTADNSIFRNEPGKPGTPGRPTVSGASTTSLNVRWAEPSSNGGSVLTGYNIRYQEGSGAWEIWSHSGTGTSTTITGLSLDTDYGVQVQAVNNIGASGWSGTGRGRTDARPNNPPAPVDDSGTVDEDDQVTIDVLANDPADLDEASYGDRLMVVRVSNPPNGRAWIIVDTNNPDRQKVVYAPDPDFNGTDMFRYTVDDGSGTGSARASARVIMIVNSLPDPPVAGNDRAETDVDTPVVINVLANDRDADGDPLDVIAVTDPAHGTAVLNADDTITYTPEQEYYGMDAFAYTLEADDGDPDTLDTAIGNVTVRVRPPYIERVNRVHNRILPEVTRTITDMSQDAISVRFETAGAGGPGSSTSFRFGGSSDLGGALLAQAPGLQKGAFDAGRFLADSSFSLGSDDTGRGYTVWGGGDFRALSNPQVVDSTGFLDWSGEVVSGHLGADSRLRPDLLVGMMVSVSKADFDYVENVDGPEVEGRYRLDLLSFNPYANWTMPSGVDLWGTLGTGGGEIRIDDEVAEETQSSDLEYRSLSLGFRGRDQDLGPTIPGGTTTMTLKGDGSLTSGVAEGTETLEELTARNSRLRMLAEIRHERILPTGSEAHSDVEFGFRQDDGDGESGTAIELGGGVRYLDHSRGLAINSRVQALLSHNGEVDEWGLAGSVVMDPRPDSLLGFAMSMTPSWGGASQGGAQALWERDILADRSSNSVPGGRMEATVGYGFAILNGRYAGIPHAALQILDDGQSYRLGYRLNALQYNAFDLNLEGRRHEHDTDRNPEHVIELRGRVGW